MTRTPAVRPAQPAARERRVVVPQARFRGSGSEANVREIAPNDRTLAPTRLQSWVREQNHQPDRSVTMRPRVDVVGNRVPAAATFLDLRTPSYRRIAGRFGAPRHTYVVVPGAVWGGGFYTGGHHRHTVVVNCYYPFYYSDPGFSGFYYTGYYPSVYTYFGWAPGWIYPERVYYAPADYVYFVPAPYGGYRLDYRGANQAIEDVRQAWLEGDINPLASHLTDQLDIRVYFEGEYSYTTATDDFYAMTLDTLATVQTIAMDFDEPIWISSHEVFYTGRQVYEDPDGMRHTVYVSFRFRNLGGEWYLVAVGTSRDPIQHHYTDFRYR